MAVSDHSKEIFRGTFWSLAGYAAVRLISFFYVIIVARTASVDDVGTFYLALSITGVLGLFTDLGMASSFGRYVPYLMGQDEGKKLKKLLQVTYMAVGAFGLAVSIIMFLASDALAGLFQNPSLSQSLRILSPFMMVSAIFSLNIGFLQARKNLRDVSAANTFQNAAKLAITLVLFFIFGATLFSISAGYLLSFVAALAISAFYVVKPLSEVQETGTDTGYKELMQEVIPFGLTLTAISSFWIVINYSDRILLGYLLPPEISAAQVGIYSVATSLSMLIMIFPSAVGSIFFPLVSELLGKGRREEVNEVCATALRWTLFITFPLAIVLIAFPEDLLRMFYGNAYTVGGFALAVFALGLMIRSLTYVHSLVLMSLRMLRIELNIAVSTALLNIVLNWLLVPKYGMNGSAIASTISFTLVSVLFIYYSKKLTGFHFPPESMKALLAGLLALGLLLLTKTYVEAGIGFLPGSVGNADSAMLLAKALRLITLGFLFVIACVFYVSVLFLLRSFSHEDVHMAQVLMERSGVPQAWTRRVAGVLNRGVHS